MKIFEAQADMRKAYLGGAPGVLISATVWLSAAVVAWFYSPLTSALVFFLGGMFIHPLSIVLAKVFKGTGKAERGNPLTPLAIQSTLLLFAALLIAFAQLPLRPEWFFPVMLLLLGVRYTLFSSLYGLRVYWILGGFLALAGALGLYVTIPFYGGALLGGGLELLFGLLILWSYKKLSIAQL